MKDAATILVPVDFSSHSRAAVERAVLIAEACNAKIQFLHAFHLPPVALARVYSQSTWKNLSRFEHSEIESLTRDFRGRGPRLSSCLLAEGDPAHAVCAVARAPGVELVVMGSRGRRGVDRFLLGSVAERTLHNSPVPVLIVRESEAEAAEPIRSILFATDFSESAARMEAVVLDLARLFGSEVEIIHAIPKFEVSFDSDSDSDSETGANLRDREIEAAAMRQMEDSRGRFLRAGVSVRATIVSGFASEEITNRAESTGAQLIAMGTRGQGGIQPIRASGVVQRVLRDSSCSVLVACSRALNATRQETLRQREIRHGRNESDRPRAS